MADQIVNIPGVGDVAFPDSMSEQEITTAAGRLYQESAQPNTGSIPGAGVVAGLSAAALPAVVRGVNAAAKAGQAKRLFPALLGYDALSSLARGDVKRAATDAVSAYAVPKALGAVVEATAPVRKAVARDALGRFVSMPTAGGFFARLAGMAGRYAGPIGVATDAVFGEGAAGHRPLAESPATTAQRSADFAAEYRRQQAHAGQGRTGDIDLPAMRGPTDFSKLSTDELIELAKETLRR